MRVEPPADPAHAALRIAVLDDHQGVALRLADWSVLGQDVSVTTFQHSFTEPAALVQALQPFEVVVAMRERTAFPEPVLAALPRLRLLASTGVRNAAIDRAACQRLGIVACGSPGAADGLTSTVEMAWSLILGLAKGQPEAHQATRAGRWQPALAQGLHGKRLGLLGLGRVGQQMARIGQAFGMQVWAWSPGLTPARAQPHGVQAADKAALFAQCDVVSLHLVLSERTRHVVAAAELSAMPAHALLVNTARAGLIDEAALIDALRHGRLGGVGLDVHAQEPLPAEHPIGQWPRVLLSPHLGYVTPENLAAFYRGAIDNIRRWRAGDTPSPLLGED